MSTLTSPVDIRADHLEIVQDILRTHLPAGVKVWVFGSRATWTTKDSSDLDLAVEGDASLDHGVMVGLEIAFEESDLPYTVDVVDLNLVDARFKQIVEMQRVPLIMATEQSTVGEWRKCELRDLTDNFDSIRVPVKQGNRRRGTYPYYGASGVIDYVDGFLFDGEYLLIAEDGENLRTRTAPIAFLATGKFWVNNHAHIVRGNSNADARFLKYALSQLDVSGYLTGSTMPKLTQENMNRISVLTPPLPEQRAIAHILGTLDDKIELNRRMNQTLDEMARALFKSWFVDFGPVRAKLEGQAPYLPPELWDLFPDDFVDSELGEIPEGWDVKTLSEVVTHLRTNENPSKYPDTLFSHFSIPAYDLGQVPKQDLGGSIKSSKTVVQPGVVLLSKLNPEIERVWLVDVAAGERAICSTEFLALSPRLPFPRSYVYCYFQTPAFRSLIQTLVTGTSKSHQRVQPSSVLSLPAIIPSEQVIDAFERQAEAFLANSLTRRRETTGLAAQRDALLPELVPGAWGIGDGGIHA